jgi:hypothetical protein
MWAVVVIVVVVCIYVGVVVSIAQKLQFIDKVIPTVSPGFQSFIRKLEYVGLRLCQWTETHSHKDHHSEASLPHLG